MLYSAIRLVWSLWIRTSSSVGDPAWHGRVEARCMGERLRREGLELCERDGAGEGCGAEGMLGEVGKVVRVLVSARGVLSEVGFSNLSVGRSGAMGVAACDGVGVAACDGVGVAPSDGAEMAAVCAGKV